MTKKEKELLKTVYDRVNHIVNWDNKNLKQAQYYDLSDCLEDLAVLLKIDED